jgi:ATP-dependent exoDNAse (exonuclease V) beta subunit
VVFVAAMHKGVESSPPVVSFAPGIGLGARWRNPAVREDKDDLFQHAIRESRKQRELEEGNRLLYVAMTRAEQHLAMTFSGKPAQWAKLLVSKMTVPEGEDRAGYTRARRMESPPTTTELLELPSLEGQHDTNATVTALAGFARCPREYYLGHYLGFEGRVRDGDASATPAAELGTQVHTLLAGTAVEAPDPEAVRLADVFRKGPLGRRVAHASRVEREFDFLMAIEGLVVHGQIDLWFEDSGELVIVDYKTDAVNGMQAHQRAADYALQLRLYATAVEKATGRAPDQAWLHFLKPDVRVRVDLTPSLLESPEQLVRDFLDAQSTLNFPLNEGSHCQRCRFHRDLCPA